MGNGAASFEVRTERPDRVVKAALDRWRRLRRPSVGLLFVSGRLAEHLSDIAAGLAAGLTRGLASESGGRSGGESTSAAASSGAWLVAAGAGVLTERGEMERQSATAGLILEGVRATGVGGEARVEAFAQALGDALRAEPSASAFVLVRADAFEEDLFGSIGATSRRSGMGQAEGEAAGRRAAGARVFGGGTLPERDVLLVHSGRLHAGPGAALLLSGMGPARIAAAPACRLLGPWRAATRTRGSMLLEIEGERALDVLSASAEGLPDQPLLLLAIEGAPEDVEPERSPWSGLPSLEVPRATSSSILLRAIQGVDPSRGGVLVGELPPDARVAFAVRDGSTGRQALGDRLGALSRAVAGSAPRFGIYVNCAGRGAALYGAADVDTKLIRSRFGDLPLVGLQTAFELAPFGEVTALQLYTGVFALFCAPS